jgi:hypothetical protein
VLTFVNRQDMRGCDTYRFHGITTPILEAMRLGLSMVVKKGNGNISGRYALAF